MNGYLPVVNAPAVNDTPSFNWAIQIRWSPLIKSLYCPNSNQNGAYKIWCNPNGIRERSITPKINVVNVKFLSNKKLDKPFNPPWIGGHTKLKRIPVIIATTDVTIGTKRFPAKNPKNGGNVIL